MMINFKVDGAAHTHIYTHTHMVLVGKCGTTIVKKQIKLRTESMSIDYIKTIGRVTMAFDCCLFNWEWSFGV